MRLRLYHIRKHPFYKNYLELKIDFMEYFEKTFKILVQLEVVKGSQCDFFVKF